MGTDGDGSRPRRAEQARAFLLAALLSALFLGEGLLPGRVLLPFAPECFSPWHEEAEPEAREAADARAVPHLADKWLQCLPFHRLAAESWRSGRAPAWTEAFFGGHMLGADVVPQAWHPLQLLHVLFDPFLLYGVVFLLMQAGTGLFLYRFLRLLGAGQGAALLGMVAWSLGLWVQARVHHPMVLTAAFTLPLALEAVERLARKGGGGRGAAVLALAVGSAWLGGFLQSAVQVTLLAAAYALFRRRDLGGRGLARAAAGLAAGCLIGCVQVLPALQATELSVRGRETAEMQRAHALQPAQLAGAVAPNLLDPVREFTPGRIDHSRLTFGQLLLLRLPGGIQPTHTEAAFYAGLLPLLLALGAFLRRSPGAAIFFSATCLVALLLAMGAPPLLELARAVPGAGLGDMRRWLLTAAFSLAVLAALGAQRLVDACRGRVLAWPALALALAAGVLLLLVEMAGAEGTARWFGAMLGRRHGVAPALAEEQLLAALAPGEAAWQFALLRRSFLLLAATAAAAFLLLRTRTPGSRLWWVLLLATVSADLLLQGRGRCAGVPRAHVLAFPEILEPIRTQGPGDTAGRFQRLGGRPEGVRQMPLLAPPNLPVLLGVPDAAGYTVFSTQRLDEFWNALEPEMALGGTVTSFTRAGSVASPLLDLYSVRWILADRPLQEAGLADVTPETSLATGLRLYRRDTALPRVLRVDSFRVLPDPAERLAWIASPDLDPLREVVLEEEQPPLPAPSGQTGHARILRSSASEVVVGTAAPGEGYLVLADPWHPAWRAEVDGVPAPVLQAFHALRAVRVPEGGSIVRFFLRPVWLWAGLALTVLGLGFALVLGLPRRRRA